MKISEENFALLEKIASARKVKLTKEEKLKLKNLIEQLRRVKSKKGALAIIKELLHIAGVITPQIFKDS